MRYHVENTGPSFRLYICACRNLIEESAERTKHPIGLLPNGMESLSFNEQCHIGHDVAHVFPVCELL